MVRALRTYSKTGLNLLYNIATLHKQQHCFYNDKN